MGTYVGNTLVAGATFNPTLLDFKWADHILNDISWLRADTFSWQPGSVYSAVYQHLANDINGKTLQSETISGTTIQFYLSDDGHKVCPDSQESNVEALYTATGVAWYYIIDTTNQRFKLPRTKFAFTGLRDTVGKYVAPGLPNITGTLATARQTYAGTVQDASGAFTGEYPVGASDGTYYGTSASYRIRYTFNAHNSNSIYGNSTTVQPPATQMYLYFYVGNFTQTALENTAGVSTEILNDLNEHKVIAFQAPTSENNYTWYRKYADGWVEQGGVAGSGVSSITFPVTMADDNYTIVRVQNFTSSMQSTYPGWTSGVSTKTATGFTFNNTANSSCWQVSGMAA